MKKTLYIFIAISLIANIVKAQTTDFDALNLAQTEIRGTARYMGMAGAFAALGGDASAVKNNAGGLAIYRSSELSLSYSLLQQDAKALYNKIETRDRLNKFGYNNFSYVWSMDTRNTRGLLYSNWSFSHNRTKNFNRSARVAGNNLKNSSIVDRISKLTNDANVIDKDLEGDLGGSSNLFNDINRRASYLSIMAYSAFLIDYDENKSPHWAGALPTGASSGFNYDLSESGYIGESSLAWGGNINNTFYLGASVNLSNISYQKQERYIESSDKSYSGTEEIFEAVSRNSLSTTGAGFNFNFGLIYRPIDPLRIGIAYTTTTRYSLRDETYDVSLNDIGVPFSTYYDYSLRTPGKINASISYLLGGRLILSSEFIYSPLNYLFLSDEDKGSYDPENEMMNKFNAEISFKTGIEYRLSEKFYARAGFAHTGSSKGGKTAMPSDIAKDFSTRTIRTDLSFMSRKSNRYYSAGLGYRSNFWSIDFACVKRDFAENFTPYGDNRVETGIIKTNSLDFIGTLAFRF